MNIFLYYTICHPSILIQVHDLNIILEIQVKSNIRVECLTFGIKKDKIHKNTASMLDLCKPGRVVITDPVGTVKINNYVHSLSFTHLCISL